MKEYKPPARQNPEQIQYPADSKVSSLSINRAITHTVDTLVPDLCETVLNTPIEKMSEMDSITCQDSSMFPSGRHAFQRLAAIAVCFLLIITGGYGYFNYIYTDSIIDIDINPGIELSINRQNKVTKASAVNKEAEEILDTLKLNGTEINTAASAIIGALYVNGFFSEDENYLLLSVTGRFGQRQSGLIDDITKTIENSIQDDNVTLHIINQSLGRHSSASQLAKKYSVTLGKANLIESLLNADSSLNPGELADLSIDRLLSLLSGLNEETDLDKIDKAEEKETKAPASSLSPSPAPSKEDITEPSPNNLEEKNNANTEPDKQDTPDKTNGITVKTPSRKQQDKKEDNLDKNGSDDDSDDNDKDSGDNDSDEYDSGDREEDSDEHDNSDDREGDSDELDDSDDREEDSDKDS